MNAGLDTFNGSSHGGSVPAEELTVVEEISPAVIVLRTIFITLDALFTMSSNLFCIWVILRTSTLSESAKVFMIALAAADFSVGVTAAFSVIPAATGFWLWGSFLCEATSALVTIFCLASVSFLVCLSVDRMIAVTRSLHYPTIMTQRKAVLIMVSVWVVSTVVITGTWFVGPPVSFSNYSVTCAWQWDDSPRFIPYALAISLCFFILPSTLLCVMYCIMFKISRKHTGRVANRLATPVTAAPTDSTPTTDRQFATRSCRAESVLNWRGLNIQLGNRKAMKMFFVITMAFTVAWLPYSVTIVYSCIHSLPFPPWAGFLITWLAISNSWFNVIIYVCMNGALRETALRLLKNWRYMANFRRCCFKSRVKVGREVTRDNLQTVSLNS